MPKQSHGTQTMTQLLRNSLAKAESVRAVAKATGVQQASLVRFLNGQQSLRLDAADKLAVYFRVVSDYETITSQKHAGKGQR